MVRKKIKSPVPTSFIIKTQGNTIIFFSEFDSLNRLLRTTPIIYNSFFMACYKSSDLYFATETIRKNKSYTYISTFSYTKYLKSNPYSYHLGK